ncbi:MAG: hypothetical protein AABY22_31800 [Nanoarchaeota archaeon]
MKQEEIIEASRTGTMKAIKQSALTFIIIFGIFIFGIFLIGINHSEYKMCVYVHENNICDYAQPISQCSYFGTKDYVLNCFRAVDRESSGVAGAVGYYVASQINISDLTFCSAGQYGCVLHDQVDYTSHGLEFGYSELNKSIERCARLFCNDR